MLARQIRFTCPHCGTINRAPVRSIGRGGTCMRCGGGVKVPSAHAVEGAIDEAEVELPELSAETTHADLIGAGFERSAADDAEVPLFDLGRPSRPTRSVTAPSAVVAEATMLPTASQLASSDRSDRNVAPPVQTLRSLRRFTRTDRPRRHVAARRQQPGTPWWAWLAHGTLTVGAIYALASLYNGNFNASVNAYTPPSPRAFIDDDAFDAATTMPSTDTDFAVLPTNDEAVAELIAKSMPDERIWIRYERILLANKRQQYAVVRVTQSRDGQVRIDRNETSARPAEFPEDAALVDRRGSADAATPDAR